MNFIGFFRFQYSTKLPKRMNEWIDSVNFSSDLIKCARFPSYHHVLFCWKLTKVCYKSNKMFQIYFGGSLSIWLPSLHRQVLQFKIPDITFKLTKKILTASEIPSSSQHDSLGLSGMKTRSNPNFLIFYPPHSTCHPTHVLTLFFTSGASY